MQALQLAIEMLFWNYILALAVTDCCSTCACAGAGSSGVSSSGGSAAAAVHTGAGVLSAEAAGSQKRSPHR